MLLGRDQERAQIGELLESAAAGRSQVLVVTGEAGSGKSALLEDTRDRAAHMQVLTVRGVQAESELPFAGLHQLLRPAVGLIERLPQPQAVALEGALGMAHTGGDNRFLVSAATLSLLAELAEARPVLCLIDDVQWLDSPSADALLFAARRLEAEQLAMVFAGRGEVEQRFAGSGLPVLRLGGLDAESAGALIAREVDGQVAAAVSDALVDQAAGNPLALVALPSSLSADQLAGTQPLPETLPLSRDVERLFLDRVGELPEPTQRLLLLIAADDGGSLSTVLAAARSWEIPPEALDPAEQTDLVSVTGQRVTMSHPLIRSAVYLGSTSVDRRAAHLALADALTSEADADRRAWHLATAAIRPDAAIADALEQTADRARLRSGYGAASAALRRAAELSDDGELRGRRLLAGASCAWQAGQPDVAASLLESARPAIGDARLQAEADHLRGLIEWRCGSIPAGRDVLLEGAARIAADHPRLALEMLFDAGTAAWDSGDYTALAEVGRIAAALPRSDDRTQQLLTDVLVGVGRVSDAGQVDRTLDLAALGASDELDEPRLLAWAAIGAAIVGENEAEGVLLRRAASLARSSGAVDDLTLTLEGVGVQGFLSGNFAVAVDAAEGLQLAEEARLPNAATLHRASLAWIAGARGREEECLHHADRVRDAASRSGAMLAAAIAEWGVGLLELGIGKPNEASSRLQRLTVAGSDVHHPFYALVASPDLIEALVRGGDEDAARGVLADLEEALTPGAPDWLRAVAARSRGLVDGDQAAFDDALELHDLRSRPFDRARTQLAYGELLRRRRQRATAREHLRAALDGFEQLEAAPWAERARSELRASGETARKRDPSTISDLTPQELQVARFVTRGLSNKEVAAQLFLSPRTVDSHLRNIFGKLGITSRTQLVRLPLGDEPVAQS
jgi:DNA-binding CsgD family transcriptional regulator